MQNTLKITLQNMSLYHQWAYNRLYEVVDTLSPDLYYKDFGLFFKSIHGTLNHLFVGDNVWLSRFNGTPFSFTGLDQEIYSNRLELKKAIFTTAEAWVSFCAAIESDKLAGVLSYGSANAVESLSYSGALFHVFNHATHHRGQCSAALTILLGNENSPVMDLAEYLRRHPTQAS